MNYTKAKNNFKKYMNKIKQFEQLEEQNEFFGITYDENISHLIKLFILKALKQQREEIIEMLEEMKKEDMKEAGCRWNRKCAGYMDALDDIINQLKNK